MNLTRARGREEAKRHALKVLVEAVPEILHDALPDDRRQVGLPDADRAAEDGETEHERHEHV